MTTIDYVGFDVHKKTISFCAKAQDGRILDEGIIPARRAELSAWAQARGPKRGHGRGWVRWKRRCSADGSTITYGHSQRS